MPEKKLHFFLARVEWHGNPWQASDWFLLGETFDTRCLLFVILFFWIGPLLDLNAFLASHFQLRLLQQKCYLQQKLLFSTKNYCYFAFPFFYIYFFFPFYCSEIKWLGASSPMLRRYFDRVEASLRTTGDWPASSIVGVGRGPGLPFVGNPTNWDRKGRLFDGKWCNKEQRKIFSNHCS